MKLFERNCTVYCLMNLKNGNRYVGATLSFVARKRRHWSDLRLQKHRSQKLQEDYNIHGDKTFTFLVLEEFIASDKDFLYSREQHWIDFYRPEYNINQIAGSYIGESARSPDARKKQANAIKGRKQSPEHILARMTTAKKNGKHKLKRLSEDQKKHLSEINTGEKNPNFGLHRTDASKAKTSDKMSKIEYTFQNPDGELVVFRNTRKWGKEMGIPRWVLQALIIGKKKEYNGWRYISRRKL